MKGVGSPHLWISDGEVPGAPRQLHQVWPYLQAQFWKQVPLTIICHPFEILCGTTLRPLHAVL